MPSQLIPKWQLSTNEAEVLKTAVEGGAPEPSEAEIKEAAVKTGEATEGPDNNIKVEGAQMLPNPSNTTHDTVALATKACLL